MSEKMSSCTAENVAGAHSIDQSDISCEIANVPYGSVRKDGFMLGHQDGWVFEYYPLRGNLARTLTGHWSASPFLGGVGVSSHTAGFQNGGLPALL
ncbi:hypothetical protein Tco_0590303 [Tanacetum coccineum]